MSKAEAREAFYGMAFERWKDAHPNAGEPRSPGKICREPRLGLTVGL
jgi:hypothetical protein